MESIDLSRVHLIGIGGAGMSGVARILLARGAVVSGSDVKQSRPVQALQAMGAHISVGHAAENLQISGALPTVVVTSFAAIPQDNPELVAAKHAGIPIIRRSDLLGELLEGSKQVLIAGTHGKTSTTSLAVVAMQRAGMDPSFAIGGQLNKAGTNAHQGNGEVFVAEADESDASLLRYRPDIAVVTNVEPDHLDFFHTPEAYFQVFRDFVAKIVPGGHLVVCLEDEHARALAQNPGRDDIQIAGYGFAETTQEYPDLAATKILSATPTPKGTLVKVEVFGQKAQFSLAIPGRHIAANAAAALTAGVLAGGDLHKLAQGMSEFSGVRRRFEFYGRVSASTYRGVEVYDDYAHHPTEVTAVLRAARESMQARVPEEQGRILVCFQPHLYSRTIEFAAEFAQALSLADEVIVLDIFGAREKPVEGVSSRIITDQVEKPVLFEPDFSAVPEQVALRAKPFDMVFTMGAGSVTMLAQEILTRLESGEE